MLDRDLDEAEEINEDYGGLKHVLNQGDDNGGYRCTAESIRTSGDAKYSLYNVICIIKLLC